MELDAIRFSIGPWNGRYSSVWRIWSNPGSDDVYLGVRTVLKYLKVSLHKSGKFRTAFTNSYNQLMVERGKDSNVDRAFLKWDKKPVSNNEIMQALDIHFPLPVLSLTHRPQTMKGKSLFLMEPHEASLGDHDSVTVKVLFHRIHPDSAAFHTALDEKNIMRGFWVELSTSEFVSICFQYSKQLPISVSEEEQERYAAMFHQHFTRKGKKVGDIVDELTIQMFEMGWPPAIYNIGRVSAHWKAEKHFSIDIGT